MVWSSDGIASVESIGVEGTNSDLVLSTVDWGGANMDLSLVARVSDSSDVDVPLSTFVLYGFGKVEESNITFGSFSSVN